MLPTSILCAHSVQQLARDVPILEWLGNWHSLGLSIIGQHAPLEVGA